uniref:Uncharacterized protein LOC114334425 n=1 Tax=Diabrotica virgifera virgifera TaxID=50390 RepID=A0A6P7G5R6_DIAVI
MDKKNKKSGSKQIFIITPDELARLGILAQLSSAAVSAKPDEDTTPSPSTSKSVDKITETPSDICNILRTALKKKLTAKNPTDHQTQELSVKQKIGKKIRTKVLSGELELSGPTQETHVTVPKTTNKSSNKTVSVISNTAVNLSKDTIHQIVSHAPIKSEIVDKDGKQSNHAKITPIISKIKKGKTDNSEAILPVSTVNLKIKKPTHNVSKIIEEKSTKPHTEELGHSIKTNTITNEIDIADHDDKSNKIVEKKGRELNKPIKRDRKGNLNKQTQIQEVVVHGSPDTDIITSIVEYPHKKNKSKKVSSTESESRISDSYIIEHVEQCLDLSNKSNELLQGKIDRTQCDVFVKESRRPRLTVTDKTLIRNTSIRRSLSRKPPKLVDKTIDKVDFKQISIIPLGSKNTATETELHETADTDFKYTEIISEEKNLDGKRKSESPKEPSVHQEELKTVLRAPVDTSARVMNTSVDVDESCEKPIKKKGARKSKNPVVPEFELKKYISDKRETELIPITPVNAIELVQKSGDIVTTSIDNSIEVFSTCTQRDKSCEKSSKERGSRKSKNLVVSHEKNSEDVSETKKSELVLITPVSAIEIVQKSIDISNTSIDNSVKVADTCVQVSGSCEKPAKRKGGKKSKNPVVLEVEPQKSLGDITEKKKTELVPITAVTAIGIVQKSVDTHTTYIDNSIKVLNTCVQEDESCKEPAKKKGGKKSKNLVVPEFEPEKNISDKKETELVSVAVNSIERTQKTEDIPTSSTDNSVRTLTTRVQLDESCEKPTQKKEGRKSKNPKVPEVEPEKTLEDISDKKEMELIPITAVTTEIVQKSGDTSSTSIDNSEKVLNTHVQEEKSCKESATKKGRRKSKNLVVPEVELNKNLKDIGAKKDTELVPIIGGNDIEVMQKSGDTHSTSTANSVKLLNTSVQVHEICKEPDKKKGGRKSKNLVVAPEKNLKEISKKKETEPVPNTAVNAIEILQIFGDTSTISTDNSVKVLNTLVQIDESCEIPAKKKGGRRSKNLVVPEVEPEKDLEDISENKETELVRVTAVNATEIVQISGDTPISSIDNSVNVLNTCVQVDESCQKPANTKGGRKSKNLKKLVPITAVNAIDIVQKSLNISTTPIDTSVKVLNTCVQVAESYEKSPKKKGGRKSKNLVVLESRHIGNIGKDHIDIIAEQLVEEKNLNDDGDKKEIEPVPKILESTSFGAQKTEQISTSSMDNSISRIKVNDSSEIPDKKKRGKKSQSIVVPEVGPGGNTDHNIVTEEPIEDRNLENHDKKENTESGKIQNTGDVQNEDIDKSCKEPDKKKGIKFNKLVVPNMINKTGMNIEPSVEKSGHLNKETKGINIAQAEQAENNDNRIEKSGKKKRERRRKNVWLTGIESVNQSFITDEEDTSTFDISIEETDQNEELATDVSVSETSIEQPTKKRRGRPPKGDSPAPVTTDPEPTVKYHVEESKRGRKRAKINYLEVEMMGQETQSVTTKRKRKATETFETKPTKMKRDKEPDTDYKVEEDTEVIDEASNSNEVADSDKPAKDKRKYAWNGNTVKMYSQMFSALQDNPVGEQSAVAIPPSRYRGRPRKDNDVNRSLVCDEQDQVTCAICREILPYEDWSDHNVDRHYNLAWRAGEVQLFLDDYAVLRSKLQQFFGGKKILSCLKCNKACTKLLEFVCHREECEGILVKGDVTCAVCNKTMDRKLWTAHKLKHNNLAWRVGDYPLDLNSDVLVLKILNALYNAKKPLTCETCGAVKKSVVGFLSHRGQCGKNIEEVKVKCELCDSRCLPSSIPSHMKSVHNPKKKTITSDYFDIDITVPQGKRKAAKRALDKIDEVAKEELEEYLKYYEKQLDFKESKNFIAYLNKELHVKKSVKCKMQNCQFESDNTSTLLDHMSSCPSKPTEYFTCKTCFSTHASQEETIHHLRQAHSLKIGDDDDCKKEFCEEDEQDGVVSERSRKRRSIAFQEKKQQLFRLKNDSSFIARPVFVLETSKCPKDNLRIFSHAFKYSINFCETHYIDSHDLKNFICNKDDWGLLEEESIEMYLPPSELSCDVFVKTVNGYENVYNSEYTFKKYELFEAQRETDTITIFCGGPVHSLAWLPTPYNCKNKPQILAVGTSRDFDAMYQVDGYCNEPTLIQFWNFGILRNVQEFPEPRLEFGLAVDYGPIWHLEWCPSGCYNVEDSGEWTRIGLLAVSGSTMPVYLYSVPSFGEDKSGLFYKPRPLLKLQLTEKEAELKRLSFPTKISWSKTNGSCSIAVGYSDGTVAVYNLKAVSNSLDIQGDNSTSKILLPSKVIKAHSHYVSALSWIPVGTDRFLFSGSFDKSAYVWDLHSQDKFATKKGGIVTDGTWLTNWLSHMATTEESSPKNCNVASTLYAHRSFIEDTNNLNSSLVTVLSLSASDWLNGFVQGNSVGEVVAFFPHQMMFNQDSLKKRSKYRFLIGYTRLIDKSKSPEGRAASEKKKREMFLTRSERSKTFKVMDVVDDKELHYEPLDYREAAKKYGLVFCDTKSDVPCLRKSTHENVDLSKQHLYPLQEVRKVCFNPNRQASLYFASGYQTGFVRVSYLKFLEKDPQITFSENWDESTIDDRQ